MSRDLTVLDIGLIMRTVARRYQTTVELMRGRRNAEAVLKPRHMAIWLTYRLLPSRSSAEIGRAFNRDHTTILSAIKRVEERCLVDEVYAGELRHLEADLRAMALIPDADQDAALQTAATIASEVNHILTRSAAADPVGFMARVGKLFKEKRQ